MGKNSLDNQKNSDFRGKSTVNRGFKGTARQYEDLDLEGGRVNRAVTRNGNGFQNNNNFQQGPPNVQQPGVWRNGVFIPQMPGMQVPGMPPLGLGFPFAVRGAVGGGRIRARRGRGAIRGTAFTHIRHNKDIDDSTNRWLILEKLPEDKFDEQSIREYFSTFGNITGLAINQDTKIVELEYETHEQARNAWSSPEPIFGNRFVKVYWKKTESSARPSIPPSAAGYAQPILPFQPATQQLDVEAITKEQLEKQKAFEEKMAKKKEHDEKMKEILQKKFDLLRQKKEQQELLINAANQAGQDLGPELTEKMSNVEALKLQLETLKAEAEMLGVSATSGGPPAPSYRGRGGYSRGSFHPYRGRGSSFRGRGGGFVPTTRSNLDLRPRTVLLSPISSDHEEALRSHLLSIGEFENVTRSHDQPNGILVTFKDRKAAEKLFYGPKEIPSVGPVEKEWKQTPQHTIRSELIDEGAMDTTS